jgi:hypothetical protein
VEEELKPNIENVFLPLNLKENLVMENQSSPNHVILNPVLLIHPKKLVKKFYLSKFKLKDSPTDLKDTKLA